MRNIKWKVLTNGILAVALAICLILVGLNFTFIKNNNLPKLSVTVGNPVNAYTGTVDYSGTTDVQVQQAVNALAVTGGEVVLVSPAYTFSNTVLRAIDNVLIRGLNGTTITYAGACFNVGVQSGWKFQDIIIGAGGSITNYTRANLINVTINGVYYAYRLPSTGGKFIGDLTGNADTATSAGSATTAGTATNQSGGTVDATEVKDDDLTSGRVTFATTNGKLTDDNGFEYNSGTDTITVGHYAGDGSALTGISASGVTVVSALPGSPTSGGLYLHSTTGRKILYEYDGSAWSSIQSYGNLTLYVDPSSANHSNDRASATYGTDTTHTFDTIQYAYDTIPPSYEGTVYIYVAAGNYNESLAFCDKNAIDNGFIMIYGAFTTLLNTTAITSAVAGGSATRPTVTNNTNPFTGHTVDWKNKVLFTADMAWGNDYRIIAALTNDTATLTGAYSALPTGNFKVLDWATTVTGAYPISNDAKSFNHIWMYNMAFNASSTQDTSIVWLPKIMYWCCKFTDRSIQEVMGSSVLKWCYFPVTAGVRVDGGAFFEPIGCKFDGGTTSPWVASIEAYNNATVILDGGNVFEGIDDTKVAIKASAGATVYIDPETQASLGYCIFSDWATALYAETGGKIIGTSTNVYSSNVVNENPDPALSSLRDRLIAEAYPVYTLNWGIITKASATTGGWTQAVSGTGDFTPGWAYGTFDTGATSGGVSRANCNTQFYFENALPAYYLRMTTRIYSLTAADNTSSEYWIGFFHTPASPTTTDSHLAFHILNGELYASTADASTETSVDTGLAWAQYTPYILEIKQIASVVYFYVNNALKATITTHLPPNDNEQYPTVYIVSSAAGSRTLQVSPVMVYTNDVTDNLASMAYID